MNPTKLIPIKNIRHSSTNPRKQYDIHDLSELSDSIKRHGILQPIMVKEIDRDGLFTYELIFGSRRLQASEMAGKKSIKCIVANGYSQKEIQQIQIVENCQRKDVHPLNEMNAFMELMQTGMTVQNISMEIGKSTRYIYDRLNLKYLCPEAHSYFMNMRELTLYHCLQLVKLKNNDQVRALNHIMVHVGRANDGTQQLVGFKSVRKLKFYIQNYIETDLNSAIFDVRKDFPECGSCIDCVKRSGHNKTLFNDVMSDDICHDPQCYNKKEKSHLNGIISDLESKGHEVVRISNNQNETRQGIKSIFEVSTVPAGVKCSKTITGIVVDGNNKGQTIQLCDPENCCMGNRKDQKTDSTTSTTSDADNLIASRHAWNERMQKEIVKRTIVESRDGMTTEMARTLAFVLWKLLGYDNQKRLVKNYKWNATGEGEKKMKFSEETSVAYFHQNMFNMDGSDLWEIIRVMMMFVVTNSPVDDTIEILTVMMLDGYDKGVSEQLKEEINNKYGIK